ncbi:MAG: hypothetical protein QOF26_1139, partial [Baekduia sp.]|nr:hypothetical protein [Baekduia sp.]
MPSRQLTDGGARLVVDPDGEELLDLASLVQ